MSSELCVGRSLLLGCFFFFCITPCFVYGFTGPIICSGSCTEPQECCCKRSEQQQTCEYWFVVQIGQTRSYNKILKLFSLTKIAIAFLLYSCINISCILVATSIAQLVVRLPLPLKVMGSNLMSIQMFWFNRAVFSSQCIALTRKYSVATKELVIKLRAGLSCSILSYWIKFDRPP